MTPTLSMSREWAAGGGLGGTGGAGGGEVPDGVRSQLVGLLELLQRRTGEVEALRAEAAERYKSERRLREQLRDAHAGADKTAADVERLSAEARFARLASTPPAAAHGAPALAARRSPYASETVNGRGVVVEPVATLRPARRGAGYGAVGSPAAGQGLASQPGSAMRRQARRAQGTPGAGGSAAHEAGGLASPNVARSAAVGYAGAGSSARTRGTPLAAGRR